MRDLSNVKSLHDLDVPNITTDVDTQTNADSNLQYMQIRCKYYSPHSFHQVKDTLSDSAIDTGFSLFHNNVVSLRHNLEHLQTHVLNELGFPFSVIGITETKLTRDTLDFNE